MKIHSILCLEPITGGETMKEKKIVRTAEEVKKMTATQYLDELVVPILNKALITVNKEVSDTIFCPRSKTSKLIFKATRQPHRVSRASFAQGGQ